MVKGQESYKKWKSISNDVLMCPRCDRIFDIYQLTPLKVYDDDPDIMPFCPLCGNQNGTDVPNPITL